MYKHVSASYFTHVLEITIKYNAPNIGLCTNTEEKQCIYLLTRTTWSVIISVW